MLFKKIFLRKYKINVRKYMSIHSIIFDLASSIGFNRTHLSVFPYKCAKTFVVSKTIYTLKTHEKKYKTLRN